MYRLYEKRTDRVKTLQIGYQVSKRRAVVCQVAKRRTVVCQTRCLYILRATSDTEYNVAVSPKAKSRRHRSVAVGFLIFGRMGWSISLKKGAAV